MLYGKTTDVAAARTAGLTIALGSDWSPSGSKNLLGELKAAKVVSAHFNLGFSDYDIVSMTTRNPAAILKWDAKLGTIATGKFADLLVVKGVTGDPYAHLIKSREQDVVLADVPVVADTSGLHRPRTGESRTHVLLPISELNAASRHAVSYALGLGSEHRMNLPGKAEGQWGWRFNWSQMQPEHAERLAALTRLYDRAGGEG